MVSQASRLATQHTSRYSPAVEGQDATAAPMERGSTNQNPEDLSLLELLREDFSTYENDPLDPGLWAIAVHRFGNWRMGIRSKALRAPCTIAYKGLSRALILGVGIHLDYSVKLGRRVRIWHHGGVFVNAKSIGNDVHLRQNVAIGVESRKNITDPPVIEDGVDVYAGACIAGNITIGKNAVIGPNSVVMSDVPPGTTMFGNPARRVPGANT